MQLKTLQIENFRGIAKLVLPLDVTTVLIGENNTGKTSVLEALHTCMNRGLSRRATPFSEYDFHLSKADAQPADAQTLAITLTFEEAKEDEWPKVIDEIFDKAVQVLDDDRKQLTFRVTAKFDKAARDFAVEWNFLDKMGNVLPTAKQPKLVTDLQSLAPVFLLAAFRDAGQHFHSKSSFWGPFTKNPQIEDKIRDEIEEQIGELNQTILDSHKPFEVVKARLAQVGKLLPLAEEDLVSVEAIPARILDMLSRTQIKLACRTGARLPVNQHGAGTQSLAVLFLFEAFLNSRLAETYENESVPILAIEEPEAHLHPSAIRALWSTINALPGQKLIATHSGDLLSAVPLKAIRRLARKNGQVQVFKIGDTTLDSREEQKVSYHVRAKRGALLFARCWLFVEGETEFTILPELARLLGHDFELLGICCVEFAQCGLKPLIKTARDLGIEWHVLVDGDQAGKHCFKTANALRGADSSPDRVTAIAELDIEHCLWHAGYKPIYEQAVDRNHGTMVKAAATAALYSTETIRAAIASTSKPSLAYQVIAEASTPKSPGIPAALKTAIETAIKLAGRSA